jgi:hypothetical protein
LFYASGNQKKKKKVFFILSFFLTLVALVSSVTLFAMRLCNKGLLFSHCAPPN